MCCWTVASRRPVHNLRARIPMAQASTDSTYATCSLYELPAVAWDAGRPSTTEGAVAMRQWRQYFVMRPCGALRVRIQKLKQPDVSVLLIYHVSLHEEQNSAHNITVLSSSLRTLETGSDVF